MRVSEEENVFSQHAAYQERSMPTSGLCPAEEGLKQLSECRNKAKREYYNVVESASMGSELFTI